MTRNDLQKFIDAQDGVFEDALSELQAGKKRSHWMWFIFPQIMGLGRSEMSVKYAIESLEHAQAYLADPLLRERLLACTQAVLDHDDRTATEIFGSIDAQKFQSSLTLFGNAAPGEPIFHETLEKFFDGQRCKNTVQLLGQ